MKRVLTLITVLLASIGVQAQEVNDPNAEIRTVGTFHGISVSSAFNVYLSQANEEAVAVSAASIKDREMIKVEVKNGILFISLDSDWKWTKGNRKLKAYISFKKIDQLKISGACDVFMTGILQAEVLSIHQSGASDFKGKLDVGKLTIDLSGASDMMVSGNATQLSVEASGASDFKGFDLLSEICSAKASGASDIKITVNKELSAQASGASDVKYRGNGTTKDIKSSGSSSVSRS